MNMKETIRTMSTLLLMTVAMAILPAPSLHAAMTR